MNWEERSHRRGRKRREWGSVKCEDSELYVRVIPSEIKTIKARSSRGLDGKGRRSTGMGGTREATSGEYNQNTLGMYENIITNPLLYVINIHSQKHLKSKMWGLCSFLDALENKTLPGLY